ncbi:hypothetical protein BDV93DRAFT_511122 [Ceratobasidium sp. AG-I]|nr:hypothetical protein BDV93DRAFT_511122 [Ceratobasidium sp. AG-I]
MSSAIRHRIKVSADSSTEITLHPAVSKHSIGLEILVENKSVYKLPSVNPGQTLRWDLQTFPCDVRMDSRVEIKLTKSYQLSSDSELLVGYEISETTNQTSITKSNIAFPTRSSTSWFTSKKSTSTSKGKQLTMTVRFPDTKEMAHDYSIALVKAKTMIENENSPLERIGNARVVLKTVLDFGGVVAELHPIAKLVVGLCTKAWEHLEKLEGQHDSLQDLISGLAQLSPFIESVKNRAKEVLQDTIMAILYLMEDTSNFIINYVSQMGVGACSLLVVMHPI